MNGIIGADAVKLAGLQVDMLQKFRDGQRTFKHLEWFNGLTLEECDNLAGVCTQKQLSLKQFLGWLRKNKLNSKLPIMKQVAEQEKFYQKCYGEKFRIDRKKIFIGSDCLPVIKAGLEAGSINYFEILVTPDILTEAEEEMTEAEFFFQKLILPQERDGFNIWAKTGTARWTNLELSKLLERYDPIEPEEFNAVDLRKNWQKEIIRIADLKNSPSKTPSGMVRGVFTSNLPDIPADQKIINKRGELVEPEDRSYISAIEKNVRMISVAEEIVLAAQLWVRDKTELARNTWDWLRNIIDHRDKTPTPAFRLALFISTAAGST